MHDDTERSKLDLLAAIRSFVEHRLGHLPRRERRDTAFAVLSEVYLRLGPDAGPQDARDLALGELRRVHAEDRRDRRRLCTAPDLDAFSSDEDHEYWTRRRLVIAAYLEDLFGHLTKNERFVLESSELGGATDAEIAGHLGWTLVRVRQVRSRARRRLRAMIVAHAFPAGVKGPALGLGECAPHWTRSRGDIEPSALKYSKDEIVTTRELNVLLIERLEAEPRINAATRTDLRDLGRARE